jgi:hypothetical protein
MNAASRILLLSLAVTGWAVAELPKKVPLNKYMGLWTNSPFTSKPPEKGPEQEQNILDDYALLGVSPIGVGYRVTLAKKKNPEERIIVDSDHPREGFKILSVVRKIGDPLGTVVRMSSGTLTGTVAFDEKLLAVAAAPKPNPQAPPGAGQQPGQPVQPGQPGQPPRQPRPRVVPPPTPQAQPQVQQPQPAPNTPNSRPGRRGR